MPGFSPLGWCGLALLALAACGAPPGPPSAPAPKPVAASEQLGRLVERYWDEHLIADNAISPQFLADSLNIERRYLAEVRNVPRDGLEADARLTYDIFKRQRELLIEGFTFPSELLPINPFGGMPQQFAAQASELARHPPGSAADYENWLRRIDDYVGWTQQAAVNMREGMRRGYTSPRVLIERMLPVLESLGADESANAFYAPLRSLPAAIAEPARSQLTKAITGAISQRLLPANRALHDFLQREYLPRARAGIALSELPLGDQWYAYRVKKATGAALSPDEITRLGVAEVERIGALAQTHDATALAGPELLSAYKELEAKVRAAMPSLFSELPHAEFDIQAADWLAAPASALYYQRAELIGWTHAVLYVDTGRAAARRVSMANFLQQGLPGHHLQIALQQERTDLPRFRRFGSEAAFTEGWGLYAAALGEALGLYPDEAAKSDAAAMEMRCAVALVVDTGLHAKGWTRARALDYVRAHLGVDDLDAQALIDFYAANPADALACMAGGLKFRALRTRAQQLLGARFDVREFHSQILRDGAMPMDILEAKMKAWADASK
ncbi:MAG: DUF885 domain-containing protein [Pseudomonadota bacterium]|nr:DUF885 domain-containing protein [Pseudomonadota bacterium]